MHEKSYDAFAGRFAEIAKSLKIGRGLEDGVQVGPMANKRGLETIQRMTQDALDRGQNLLAGGKAPAGFNKGHFVEPTVLGRVPDDALVMTEEPFGPIAPITTFSDYDDVIARANALPFGLAGYVFSNNLTVATRAYEDLEVGMVGVNEMLLATAEAPFGGVKESGMGREGGSFGCSGLPRSEIRQDQAGGINNMADDKARGFARGLTNYGDRDFSVYLRNSFASSMGYSREVLKKPIVGIANSFSGFNNCHRHFPRAFGSGQSAVFCLGGGLPIEFPTISLGEVFLSPTSLKFRNLMSMDTEEMIRAQPMDAVVLMGGCDKTVPAQLMGAASADLPAVQLVAGPMMTSRHGEERSGRLHRLPPLLGQVPRWRGIKRRDQPDRGALGHDGRHLRRDGHGFDHGLHCRDTGHVAARYRCHSGGACRPAARRRGVGPGRGADDRQPNPPKSGDYRKIRRECHARACWRWAGRPTRSST